MKKVKEEKRTLVKPDVMGNNKACSIIQLAVSDDAFIQQILTP